MISQRFIRDVVNNPFLSDRQKFQIYLDKTSKSQNARKKFPCPKCGDYASHIVKRSTYWKRLCASCGNSFDKHQYLEYQRQFFDYKGNGSKTIFRLDNP